MKEKSSKLGHIIRNIAIVIILLFAIGLFVYIFVSAFKPLDEVMTRARFLPQNPTFDNFYRLLFRNTPSRNFLRFFSNSLFISMVTALITAIVSALAGYGFSRHKYIGKNTVMKALLLIYVFPTIILLVPMFKIFSDIGIIDNYLSLIIMYVALAAPFCTWILISFFDSIPPSIEEAAKVDGAGTWNTLTRILLPLITPGLMTVIAFSFITSWGEFMFASIFIRTSMKNTMTLGLADFTADQYIEWGQLLAGSVIVIVPVLILFLPVAGNFIKGFIAGATKE